MQVVDDQFVFQDQLSKKWLVVPIVKLISASTSSGIYWINVFNESNAICTVFVDQETYQYVNMCTTPSIVYWEQKDDK